MLRIGLRLEYINYEYILKKLATWNWVDSLD